MKAALALLLFVASGAIASAAAPILRGEAWSNWARELVPEEERPNLADHQGIQIR